MTIKEIAALTGVSADTLRYYEKFGLIPAVPRNESGIRNYDKRFVGWIAFIQKLKASGMSLEAIRAYLQLAKSGRETVQERKEILAVTRAQLEKKLSALKESISIAEYELKHYNKTLLPETERLMANWSESLHGVA
jgi:DNA-binding transcriptional MerR regulator